MRSEKYKRICTALFVKAVNGEDILSLTEADQDFLSDLKIDPETEGR